MSELAFFIDYSRCIGCRACVQACEECDTHRGRSMIHLEVIERDDSVQTTPQVCMHCQDPICARVCPADAIKQTPDGVTQSSLKPRCIGCSNCVLACPFGVPKYDVPLDLMMKCDLCYDRTSRDLKPMCATVCPSGALFYGTRAEVEDLRPRLPDAPAPAAPPRKAPAPADPTMLTVTFGVVVAGVDDEGDGWVGDGLVA